MTHDMGWFSKDTEADMNTVTLTADERIALARLEATVLAGVSATLTLIEAGKALSEIRSRQLFRDSGDTWETYVSQRFKITRRRADQMIAFAGVQAALEETGTRVPEMSEKAARPLVGLSADTISEIVTEAAASPEGVTTGSIRKAAASRSPKSVRVPKPVRLKVPGGIVVIEINAKGVKAGNTVVSVLRDALEAAQRKAEAA